MRIVINMNEEDFMSIKNLMNCKEALKTLLNKDEDLIETQILKEALTKCEDDINTYIMDMDPIGLIYEGMKNV